MQSVKLSVGMHGQRIPSKPRLSVQSQSGVTGEHKQPKNKTNSNHVEPISFENNRLGSFVHRLYQGRRTNEMYYVLPNEYVP